LLNIFSQITLDTKEQKVFYPVGGGQGEGRRVSQKDIGPRKEGSNGTEIRIQRYASAKLRTWEKEGS